VSSSRTEISRGCASSENRNLQTWGLAGLITVHLALAQRLESLPAETRDQKIVDLCNGAIASLNEARSLDEVLGIRNTAEAFSTYACKLKCAVEAQAMTQLVVLLAEARIGAELQAAQERGEVAPNGGDRSSVRSSDTAPATLSDLGIPRQRAARGCRCHLT